MKKMSYLWAYDRSRADLDHGCAKPFLSELLRQIPGAIDGELFRELDLTLMPSLALDGASLGTCSPTVHTTMLFRLLSGRTHIADATSRTALTEVLSRYDAVICVNDLAKSRAKMNDLPSLTCQLLFATRIPVWLAPTDFTGFGRIVLAEAGSDTVHATHRREFAKQLAFEWRIPLLIARVDQRSVRRLREIWCFTTWKHGVSATAVPSLQALANSLRSDDLLVMGSYERHPFLRWILGSNTETLLRVTRGPILVLPIQWRPATSRIHNGFSASNG